MIPKSGDTTSRKFKCLWYARPKTRSLTRSFWLCIQILLSTSSQWCTGTKRTFRNDGTRSTFGWNVPERVPIQNLWNETERNDLFPARFSFRYGTISFQSWSIVPSIPPNINGFCPIGKRSLDLQFAKCALRTWALWGKIVCERLCNRDYGSLPWLGPTTIR